MQGLAAGWARAPRLRLSGRGADGASVDLRLSELPPDKDSLVIYSFMFPRDHCDQTPGPATGETALLPLAEGPCPTCAAFIDQLEGAAEHTAQLHRDADAIKHFWSSELFYAPTEPGQDPRHVGTIEPLEPARPHS